MALQKIYVITKKAFNPDEQEIILFSSIMNIKSYFNQHTFKYALIPALKIQINSAEIFYKKIKMELPIIFTMVNPAGEDTEFSVEAKYLNEKLSNDSLTFIE